jgi:hypothetical protein
MKYEDQIRKVCGDNWRVVNAQEQAGGFGLACAIAHTKGVRPNLSDLATHLQVRPDEIATGFNRLQRNGVFSQEFNLKHDDDFLGNHGQEAEDRAKASIAAIAGGFLGKPWLQV